MTRDYFGDVIRGKLNTSSDSEMPFSRSNYGLIRNCWNPILGARRNL